MSGVALPQSFLERTHRLAFARLSSDGVVVETSPGFEEVAGGGAAGRRFVDLLVEGQHENYGPCLRGERPLPEMPLHLHLARGDAAPVTLVSWVVTDGSDGLVFLGEEAAADEVRTSELLARLNARVSELARENVKKSAALERALADLREAQSMLVHREKMASLGRMTAGVAHELNNPLAYLVNNQYLVRRAVDDLLRLVNEFGDGLDLLEQGRPELYESILATVRRIDLPHLADSVPRLLDGSERGLERARAIVEGLRVFSRLDEARVKEVDLNESLQSALDLLGPTIEETGAGLEVEYGSLPLLLCSPGELNQVVENIVRNAMQAAGPGGTVRLTTALEGREIVVAVRDDGPGIAADIMERVFEPFFTTKEVGGGTGLGLSIAHAVVSAHGGRIEVESVPGHGATFIVRLPLEGMAARAEGGRG